MTKEPEATKPYVDKTGTDNKPDPLRDVYLEFPRAMTAIAEVTRYGAKKHEPRGWQTFKPEYALHYHRSKVGRHLLQEEIEGPINYGDGGLLHPAQATWNMLAYLEHFLRAQEASRDTHVAEPGMVEHMSGSAWQDKPGRIPVAGGYRGRKAPDPETPTPGRRQRSRGLLGALASICYL